MGLVFILSEPQNIEHEGLKDYFKNSIISAHDKIFQQYATDEEKQDDTKYKEFKDLYKASIS